MGKNSLFSVTWVTINSRREWRQDNNKLTIMIFWWTCKWFSLLSRSPHGSHLCPPEMPNDWPPISTWHLLLRNAVGTQPMVHLYWVRSLLISVLTRIYFCNPVTVLKHKYHLVNSSFSTSFILVHCNIKIELLRFLLYVVSA